MNKLTLVLEGMGCGGCVKNVRQALDAVSGVRVENVVVGSAVLAYDPAVTSKDAVIMALAKAGYPAREDGSSPTEAAQANGGHCGVNA